MSRSLISLSAAVLAISLLPINAALATPRQECIKACNIEIRACFGEHPGPGKGVCVREGRVCKAECPKSASAPKTRL